MHRLTIAALAAVLIAAPAFAADAPKTDAKPAAKTTATTPSKDDPDKLVCQRRHVVDSNIEQKVCKTKAQWESERVHAQEDLANRPNSTQPGTH